MLKITTRLNTEELVAALHAQDKGELRDFAIELLVNHPDARLLEEVADRLLAELQRRADPAE
ncbi:MAG: hypothetical protein AAF515_12455 [Pseudomonadota bacterium]